MIAAPREMSDASDKKKGPAEAATSPSHGSTQPLKGMDMNVKTDSTAAAGAASDAFPMDDVLEAESDLRHLKTLIDVITDMTVDAVASLSPGSSPADRVMLNGLSDMMWIARDLCDRSVTSLEDATARLVERSAQRKAVTR